MLLGVIADDFTGVSATANTMAEDLQHDLEQVTAEVVGPVPSVADTLRLVVTEEAIGGAILDVNLRGEKAYPVADALRSATAPSCSRPAMSNWRCRWPTRTCPAAISPSTCATLQGLCSAELT